MSNRRSWNVLFSHPDMRYPDVKCRRMEFLMWNVGAQNSSPGGLSYAAQGGPSACAKCRDPSPRWHGARKAIRINSIRIPQEDMWRALLSGLPQGEAHGTREHHTRTTAYPIRICCLDHLLPPPSCPDIFYSLRSGSAYGKGLQSFGSSCFWAFHCFVMDSKELSLITDCFGDQKAIKTPKLNTILLELIAKVLNMLIGLKGANYYSKVFKWVNYKLSNSTLWVVIRPSPYSPLPL